MCSITNRNGKAASPTAGVSDAGRGVPGYGHDLIEHLLNPDRMVLVEVDDQAQRLAVIESIRHGLISRHTGDAALYPGIPGESFRLW
jgi:hypothetical protein